MKVRLYQCFAPPRNHQVVATPRMRSRIPLMVWASWDEGDEGERFWHLHVTPSCFFPSRWKPAVLRLRCQFPLRIFKSRSSGMRNYDWRQKSGEWFSHPAQKYPEPVVARGTDPWRQSIANFGRVEAIPFFFMTVEKVNIKCIILVFKQLHFNSNCNE